MDLVWILGVRETGMEEYLQLAEDIASYILKNTSSPVDKIPYWDYKLPSFANEPTDASAGAIMASALYELSTYSKKGKRYRKVADEIMAHFSASYMNAPGTAWIHPATQHRQ